VPFPELHGEFTEYVGRAEDAVIAMSSYRLHIKFKESVVNVSVCDLFIYFSNTLQMHFILLSVAKDMSLGSIKKKKLLLSCCCQSLLNTDV